MYPMFNVEQGVAAGARRKRIEYDLHRTGSEIPRPALASTMTSKSKTALSRRSQASPDSDAWGSAAATGLHSSDFCTLSQSRSSQIASPPLHSIPLAQQSMPFVLLLLVLIHRAENKHTGIASSPRKFSHRTLGSIVRHPGLLVLISARS